MEKRFVSFLLIAMALLVGYSFLIQTFFGPAPKPADKNPIGANVAADGEEPIVDPVGQAIGENPGASGVGAKGETAIMGEAADPETADPKTADPADGENLAANKDSDPDNAADDAADDTNIRFVPHQLHTLGSLAPDSPYQMLVVLSNRGAAIRSVELADPKYGELNRRYGYIGEMALVPELGRGCRVQVVGPGTPVAAAEGDDGTRGLRGPTITNEKDAGPDLPGDLITRIGDTEVRSRADFERGLRKTKPGVETVLVIQRTKESGEEKQIQFTVTPIQSPLQMMHVESHAEDGEVRDDPASFLVSLSQIGTAKTRFDQTELQGLPSLRTAHWEVKTVAPNGDLGPAIEYRTRLPAAALQNLNLVGDFEIVKRFRLATSQTNTSGVKDAAGYRLQFELEIVNRSNDPQKIGYQIDGPTGLTKEGWWYSYKTHPARFKPAGARDVAWREEGGSHQLFVCTEVGTAAKDNKDGTASENPTVPMTSDNADIRMRYAGCDTQYFAAVLMPHSEDPSAEPAISDEFDSAIAITAGPVANPVKLTDVTFRLKSRLFNVAPGESIQRSYDLFLGPKEKSVLKQFHLQDFIVFGWFGWISKPMLMLLHGLYWITGKFSYGLAIVFLTVIVRACLSPLGRQMARNAQKMQELAPEMKKLAEKYKNDMEKRATAQRELFAKHKYNPLSGCWVMFIQTPLFLGLYRGLSCDIALRQAPLIPGIAWCSNLAGPDMFWHWKGIVPDAIATPVGLFGLGPYLNILPLFTVGLMIAQQKMFTPPPQDEQQKTQHMIMKGMMVFMGFVFHKVAAGLCLYIITSTLWGLGERMLLPKPGTAGKTESEAPEEVPPRRNNSRNASGSNGASKSAQRKKKKRR